MNILYIVHDNKKGGAALSFLELISYVRETNNVIVLVPHKHGYVPEQLDKIGVKYYNAHYFWWKISLPKNNVFALLKMFFYRILSYVQKLETYRIESLVRKYNIDIIHSNSSVISFGSLLSKRTGLPHVWHLREYGEEDFGLVRIVSNETYMRCMNQKNNSFIAISKSIRHKFADEVSIERICLIYNGVSTNAVKKETRELRSDKEVCFLISGNCCEQKGQRDVIEAIRQLSLNGVRRFKVFFAGNGDFSKIKRLAEQYKVDKYCIFCGLVDDMIQLRKNVDVEIVASKCEAFGRVTIEAMRMSNPVIGTNSGGTPELVQEGYTGFLYKFGDFYQLADFMEQFINNHELLISMGKNAYKQVCDRFTPQQNADAIMTLYKNIREEQY